MILSLAASNSSTCHLSIDPYQPWLWLTHRLERTRQVQMCKSTPVGREVNHSEKQTPVRVYSGHWDQRQRDYRLLNNKIKIDNPSSCVFYCSGSVERLSPRLNLSTRLPTHVVLRPEDFSCIFPLIRCRHCIDSPSLQVALSFSAKRSL